MPLIEGLLSDIVVGGGAVLVVGVVLSGWVAQDSSASRHAQTRQTLRDFFTDAVLSQKRPAAQASTDRTKVLGSAGYQPAHLGSLPRCHRNPYLRCKRCSRQAAEYCRLAACAPQQEKRLGDPAFALVFHVNRRCLGNLTPEIALDDAEREIGPGGQSSSRRNLLVLHESDATLHLNIRILLL